MRGIENLKYINGKLTDRVENNNFKTCFCKRINFIKFRKSDHYNTKRLYFRCH